MPAEDLMHESLAKNPNLDLAQWKYMLTTDIYRNDQKMSQNLLNEIKTHNMAPLYEEVSYCGLV